MKFGNQLDYFGIVILITCSLISILLFAFYDYPWIRNCFMATSLIFGSICTVLTLHPEFSSVDYRGFRATMFIMFGLSGVLPVLASFALFDYDTVVQRSGLYWLILEGVFYITGAVLYACRFPERLVHIDQHLLELLQNPLPGKFDIFGHSHQIFHIFVVIAAFCHWKALVQCYHYLHQHTLVV
ncbi:uncharacterized protein J8A68_005690 [[Candida] subhashii]|uniref:Uncharacterized protein n=1 Tax=[Candida] subhashii TaxID=561895 RepID=A0A8J5QGC4_9ASCO|nr:uncharacterized protein J8A68_005690 [[Candida] subhashii]KAG7660728.1 hypothetical protein J8A68_005690 [[Candida] subhashii]